jgi:hypothetical protein
VAGRRLRDLRRLLTAEAAPFGAKVRIERTNGSHIRGIFRVGAREASIVTAFTPGDWRFDRKVRADARRVLRNLEPEDRARRASRISKGN